MSPLAMLRSACMDNPFTGKHPRVVLVPVQREELRGCGYKDREATIAAMRNLFSLLIALALVCCTTTPSPAPCPSTLASATPCSQDAAAPPAPAPIIKDAAPAPVLDACGQGEQNLLKLGCKDERGRVIGAPNLHGQTWSSVCRANLTNGVDMKATCMAAAHSCVEVLACK